MGPCNLCCSWYNVLHQYLITFTILHVGTLDMVSLHRQLFQLMSDSPIASILNRVDIDDINQLLEYYVHDYLRSMHSRVRHNKKTEEYKVS